MTSPYIETYGITEQEYNEIQGYMSKKTLHPSLQEAILNKREETVDGDFYQQAIAALKEEGYGKTEPISYSEGTTGTRLFKGNSYVEVSLADFCGVFTDIQFKKK